MDDKYEITFNELCAVKREKIGLNIYEAQDRIGYSNYRRFELGKSNATSKNRAKIIDFYKITEDEIKKCKSFKAGVVGRNNKSVNSQHSIDSLLKSVDKIHRKVETIEIKGNLGKLMLDTARETLKDIESKLSEIAIIDELIK